MRSPYRQWKTLLAGLLCFVLAVGDALAVRDAVGPIPESPWFLPFAVGASLLSRPEPEECTASGKPCQRTLSLEQLAGLPEEIEAALQHGYQLGYSTDQLREYRHLVRHDLHRKLKVLIAHGLKQEHPDDPSLDLLNIAAFTSYDIATLTLLLDAYPDARGFPSAYAALIRSYRDNSPAPLLAAGVSAADLLAEPALLPSESTTAGNRPFLLAVLAWPHKAGWINMLFARTGLDPLQVLALDRRPHYAEVLLRKGVLPADASPYLREQPERVWRLLVQGGDEDFRQAYDRLSARQQLAMVSKERREAVRRCFVDDREIELFVRLAYGRYPRFYADPRLQEVLARGCSEQLHLGYLVQQVPPELWRAVREVARKP